MRGPAEAHVVGNTFGSKRREPPSAVVFSRGTSDTNAFFSLVTTTARSGETKMNTTTRPPANCLHAMFTAMLGADASRYSGHDRDRARFIKRHSFSDGGTEARASNGRWKRSLAPTSSATLLAAHIAWYRLFRIMFISYCPTGGVVSWPNVRCSGSVWSRPPCACNWDCWWLRSRSKHRPARSFRDDTQARGRLCVATAQPLRFRTRERRRSRC